MPYVLKAENGQYLRSRNSWETVLTDNLYLARVYTRKADATRSGNKQGRYNKKPVPLSPVEIEIREVS